jgi:hypothetical protein
MEFEEGKKAPPELYIAGMRVPGTANVMFKIRQK